MSVVRLYTSTKPSPKEAGVPESLNVDLSKPIKQGGEGRIYFTTDNKFAIKLYHQEKIKPHERKTHLEQVILLGRNLDAETIKLLCWPIAMIHTVDGANFLGSVMRRVPSSYKKLLDLVFSARIAAQQFRAGRSWAHYLQIARNIARSAEILETMGVAHTDLSYNNFLANIDNGDAVLIDLDSLVVEGFLPVKVAGTPGFMAPEVTIDSRKNPPNHRSDRHALAVNILYSLLFRNPMQTLREYDADPGTSDRIGFGKEAVFSEHPTDRRNRPSNLSKPLFQAGSLSYRMFAPPLQKLTEQALIDGLFNPDKRPTAREWIKALSWAMDELWQCPKCKLHFPYPRWVRQKDRACPFCGNRITSNLPSVLYLYEPSHGGQYSYTKRALVLGNGWHIYSDVLDPKRNPPLSRKTEPRVGHIERDEKRNTNVLINDESATWQAKMNNATTPSVINRGESIPLVRGTIIRFGDERRLVVVAE
jgi:DNA-binding helix-hairpin-helix protein with protein kinase domain